MPDKKPNLTLSQLIDFVDDATSDRGRGVLQQLSPRRRARVLILALALGVGAGALAVLGEAGLWVALPAAAGGMWLARRQRGAAPDSMTTDPWQVDEAAARDWRRQSERGGRSQDGERRP
jgi:hypothetical protein